MKISKLFKKAAALVMAAVTALSVMPATTAFAAGDIGTISFSHTYDSSGNAMRYNSSATINGYTAGGTGNYKYRMFVDGETAFCIQPGVPLKTGNTLKKAFKTVAYSSEGFRYYDFVNAEDEEGFNTYIAKCKDLALYDTGVSVEYGDKLITLSTCEYSAQNGRLVVVAKKIA